MNTQITPPDALCRDVERSIEASVGCHKHFLVAYSGGVDSTVLLHAMMRLRSRLALSLRAVYVHHGLSQYADQWAEHCQQQCQRWQVPFSVAYVDVNPQEGGIEAAARTARYHALAQHLLAGERLLTAQHQDDQCETLLLALKRGSGPAGLASMAAESLFGEARLLRPLLEVPRAALETYANAHHLCWIEDDSNTDERYDRNFLRRQVLPQLKARWPHFPAAVARSASLCAEQEQLLDELLAESLAALSNAEGGIAIPALAEMSAPRRFALLRRWLAGRGGRMPSRGQLSRLWQDVALSREDANPCLQLGDYQVRRFRDYLYWLPRFTSLTTLCLPWPAETVERPLPDGLGSLSVAPLPVAQLSVAAQGLCVRQPRADEVVSIRFGLQGYVQIVGRAHGRPAKKLWQELAVPPWERERIPLIFYNQQLIAAAGVFVTREGAVAEGEKGWCIAWHKPSL